MHSLENVILDYELPPTDTTYPVLINTYPNRSPEDEIHQVFKVANKYIDPKTQRLQAPHNFLVGSLVHVLYVKFWHKEVPRITDVLRLFECYGTSVPEIFDGVIKHMLDYPHLGRDVKGLPITHPVVKKAILAIQSQPEDEKRYVLNTIINAITPTAFKDVSGDLPLPFIQMNEAVGNASKQASVGINPSESLSKNIIRSHKSDYLLPIDVLGRVYPDYDLSIREKSLKHSIDSYVMVKERNEEIEVAMEIASKIIAPGARESKSLLISSARILLTASL